MRGRQNTAEGQYEEIGRIEAEIGDDNNGSAHHQRARNRALGIARLLRRVRHHVPAAECEQAGDETPKEAADLQFAGGGRRMQDSRAEE